MKLGETSRRRLESFFRAHFKDPQLVLPSIRLYHGRCARFITRRLRIGAITFGSRIFMRPDLISDVEGVMTAPGWLVAHEATHVLQYARAGYLRFFYLYLRDYWRALRESGKWDRAARTTAYLAITAERDAHAAEHAYRVWSAETKGQGERSEQLSQI